MSLKDKASLIFKPSRYKAGTAYSFRGTDFTFSRASTATRVNASRLIEDVASGVPRLNYDPTDLTKDPALLLETERTNLFTQSENASSWEVSGSSIVTNAIVSPDGTSNGNKLTYNGGSYAFGRSSYTSGAGTFSIFVKKGNWTYVGIRNSHVSGDHSVFDFDKEQFILVQSGHTCTFEKYPNGWYRLIDYQSVSVSPVSGYRGIALCGSDGNENGTGVPSGANVFFWGAQGELSVSYPSSYIRTSGSTVTRIADSSRITTLQSSRIVSASSGTFMVEVDKRKSPIFLNQKITVAGVSTNSSLLIDNASGAVRVRIWNNSSSIVGTITTDSFPEGTVKYLIKWNGTNTSVFANGKFVGTAAVPNYAYAIYDMFEQTSFSNNNINEALFFPSALSDEECISLTSFDDYEELVDAKGLTWESPIITNNRLTALAEL